MRFDADRQAPTSRRSAAAPASGLARAAAAATAIVTELPAELRNRRQWVTWKTEERDGKATKVPYRADGSGRASSTDPATWASFDEALDAADWLSMDGVGYVFAADDPYCGIDLDAALPAPDRGAIILALDSYTETSVSGSGAHVLVKATLPAHARNRKGPIEIYDHGRYFVMTGAHVRGTPTTIEDRQAELEEVLAHYLPAPKPAPPRPPRPIELDDRDLLEKAFAARNGPDFQRLYQGDISGFTSRSEADLAFCRTAAFWTGRDPARIDAWLRSSGLMRDKWERADYRDRTIDAAIAGASDIYTPAPRRDHGQPSAPDDHAPSSAAEERPWRSVPWSTFRDTAPPAHRWLIEGLLPAGVLCFIAGPPKRGKTWIGISIGLAIALGHPLAGDAERFTVPATRDVLYVALEGSQTGLRTRIGALARGLDVDPDGVELERLHMLYRPRPFDLAELATADWLLEEAGDVAAALVVIDVLRAAARFKENVAEEFSRVRDHLEPLLADRRTVMLLHHFGKLNETQKERSPGERMAGTGAMYGALDVGLLITHSSDGARRLAVDVEARDFAAPDRLGLAIDGEGSGKHGGFTYADTATLVVDESAAAERDVAGEVEQLLADGQWRLADEIRKPPRDDGTGGIGVNLDLFHEHIDPLCWPPAPGVPTRFVRLAGGRAVGRAATAKPYGTWAMYGLLPEPRPDRLERPESVESVPLQEQLSTHPTDRLTPNGVTSAESVREGTDSGDLDER